MAPMRSFIIPMIKMQFRPPAFVVRLGILIAIFLFISSPVKADCRYQGKTYPEGTLMNGLECINGQWR
jgi:hypothetical protein